MPTPPDKKTKLPSDYIKNLSQEGLDDDDRIVYLQSQLQVATDALEESRDKLDELEKQNAKLESANELLRDNHKIKRFAVRFSFWFIWLVPALCVILLILSITNGVGIGDASTEGGYYFEWNIELNSYTQAALVIAPIVFIATVLGFLLKGVFGRNQEGGEVQVSDLSSFVNSDNQ